MYSYSWLQFYRLPDWKVSQHLEFRPILCIYIYIIYTPNLGSETALPGRGREQGRFRGSIEGARGSIKGALSEHGGVLGEQRGSRRQRRGAADGSLNWTSSISA